MWYALHKRRGEDIVHHGTLEWEASSQVARRPRSNDLRNTFPDQSGRTQESHQPAVAYSRRNQEYDNRWIFNSLSIFARA
jgi:hypothetical protein